MIGIAYFMMIAGVGLLAANARTTKTMVWVYILVFALMAFRVTQPVIQFDPLNPSGIPNLH